ncbi:hypothetical protein [Streptodolium elevatio]|uniref:DUF4352 domain-containing protein n=1 Tax=Streptodolium elevatio TaxID=3157996 RepID=A0ABV3DS82_9ACTN
MRGYEGEHLDVTVVKVVDPARPSSDESYLQPEPGMRFVAVLWQVTNTGTVVGDSEPVGLSRVLDARGRAYSFAYADTTAGALIPYTSPIQAGETRIGIATYEVPLGAKVVTVEFGIEDGPVDETGHWTLP